MYIPGTTCLHIPLAHPCLYYYLLSPQYTVLHILFFILSYYYFFFYLYLCIFSCVVLHILHCPLSGPDLIYISLLIIFCIIEYVTNKKKNLNLEPCMCRLLDSANIIATLTNPALSKSDVSQYGTTVVLFCMMLWILSVFN